jgi:hypothetical protein
LSLVVKMKAMTTTYTHKHSHSHTTHTHKHVQLSLVMKMKAMTTICSTTGRGKRGTFQASASSVSGVRIPGENGCV